MDAKTGLDLIVICSLPTLFSRGSHVANLRGVDPDRAGHTASHSASFYGASKRAGSEPHDPPRLSPDTGRFRAESWRRIFSAHGPAARPREFAFTNRATAPPVFLLIQSQRLAKSLLHVCKSRAGAGPTWSPVERHWHRVRIGWMCEMSGGLILRIRQS